MVIRDSTCTSVRACAYAYNSTAQPRCPIAASTCHRHRLSLPLPKADRNHSTRATRVTARCDRNDDTSWRSALAQLSPPGPPPPHPSPLQYPKAPVAALCARAPPCGWVWWPLRRVCYFHSQARQNKANSVFCLLARKIKDKKEESLLGSWGCISREC